MRIYRTKNKKEKARTANTVHIAGRGSVVRQLRILASQFRVLRTGTLSEIRPDNMYQPSDCLITYSRKEVIRIADFEKKEKLKSQGVKNSF